MTTPELLKAVIEANLAGAAGIAAVIALRKPIRALAGARVAYVLWLLCPLAALATLAPPRTVAATALAPAVDLPGFVASAAPSATQGLAAPAVFDPWMLALWVWAVGAAVMLGWLMLRQARFLQDLGQGRAGPAVIGFLRPRIVTPADFQQRFSPREQAVVLAHETIHLARHDARINALAALCRCAFWFNPLIHLGVHLMRIDQELACDATVLQRHPKAAKPYAQALLKAQLATRPLPLGCYWPAGGDHPLTERIAMLKKFDVGRVRARAGGAAVATLALSAALSAWAAQPPRVYIAYPPAARGVVVPQDQAIIGAAAMVTQAPRTGLERPQPAPAQDLAAANLIRPAYLPDEEQRIAWKKVEEAARATGFFSRPPSDGRANTVAATGFIRFPDGTRAPVSGAGAGVGIYRTMFEGGSLAARFILRGDKIGVGVLMGFADGEVEETREMRVYPGQTVQLNLPNGARLVVTPIVGTQSPTLLLATNQDTLAAQALNLQIAEAMAECMDDPDAMCTEERRTELTAAFDVALARREAQKAAAALKEGQP